MKAKKLDYLFQCACFHWRKSFKRSVASWACGPKCPDCGRATNVMGRCVSALKKAGIAARGTGQFSILVGERHAELRLDKFYKPEDNPKLIEEVLHAAQKLNGNA